MIILFLIINSIFFVYIFSKLSSHFLFHFHFDDIVSSFFIVLFFNLSCLRNNYFVFNNQYDFFCLYILKIIVAFFFNFISIAMNVYVFSMRIYFEIISKYIIVFR